MSFRFPTLEDCHKASNELSNLFSGNGVHYNTNPHDWTIDILSNCPDQARARSICKKHGGS